MRLIIGTKKTEKTNFTIDCGRLLIDCRGCPETPCLGTGVCIRCISRTIQKAGEPERVVLRSAHDTEYSGDAVRLMNLLSRTDGLANAVIAGKKNNKKCSSCGRSPWRTLAEAWRDFPEPDLSAVRSTLDAADPGNKECEVCMMQTYRSAEQLEHTLAELKRECARCAFNLVGV